MDKDIKGREECFNYDEDQDIIKLEALHMQYRTDRVSKPNDATVGLALSGGGIRSASFCLGILQAMAKRKILNKVDYLSTVSGGGYIGSSLSWFLHKKWQYKKGAEDIQFGVSENDFPFGTRPNQLNDEQGPGSEEKMSILRHLRQNINYLFPGNGIGRAALFAALMRGFVINIAVYGPVLVFSLMLLALLASQGIRFDLISDFFLKPFSNSRELDKTHIMMIYLSSYCYLAAAIIAVNIGLSILYGVICGIASFFHHWIFSPRGLYKMHRRFLRIVGKLWVIAALFFIIGSLPYVVQSLNDLRLQSGVGLTLGGILSGLWSYVRTSSSRAPTIKIPTSVIVSVSAGLLIYGILILAYIIADYWLNDLSILIGDLATVPLYVPFLLTPLLLGLAINLNYVTLHGYYRDRLMELFMPVLHKVSINKPAYAAIKANETAIQDLCDYENGAVGPYHIINSNIMLPGSTSTKFNGRGGDNFILSPLYCGSNATGWQRSDKFMDGTMTFSSAMAISGAAVNPNTGVGGVGVTRNNLLSAVMAILNLRLGVWVKNPNKEFKPSIQPNVWRPGLYDSLLPQRLNENSSYIELSDGGHFENLGVYELIRRQLNVIIVCDGGADKNFHFEDFSNLVEKVRLDFGATINIDLDGMIPQQGDNLHYGLKELARQGHSFGTINYSNGKKGVLIYLKTTITADLPADVYGYKLSHDDFPDESTGDQFFDEKQFEAYRELGYQLSKNMLASLPADIQWLIED